MSNEVTDALSTHVGGDMSRDSCPTKSQHQRPCATPESGDKQFMSIMSPDTTSTRGGRLVTDVAAPDETRMYRGSDASVKSTAPTATHERKKKTQYTPTMLAVLEQCFQDNNYPTRDDRELIHARTTLSVDKIKIWFQNRRCKERRRLKALGLCSAALRMPTTKKADKCMAPVTSTQSGHTGTMYPRIPDVPWCMPSLYDKYTPPDSGAQRSSQSGPWPGSPAVGVNGLTGWGRFCVRMPQPASFTDPLLISHGNRPNIPSDNFERGGSGNLNGNETTSSSDKVSELIMPGAVKIEANDAEGRVKSFATRVEDAPSTCDKGGGDRGTKADACFQSFSSSTTTLTFAEVKPEPCSTPSQIGGPGTDGRGLSTTEMITSQQEPALRYSPVNPPTSEGDASEPRLMPLTNVALQTQHKPEPNDRYVPPHGSVDYVRQSAPSAYPCGYGAPSMFSSTSGYGQTCNPSYWYGGMPSVTSAYTHCADYRSYDTFSGQRADVQNSRDFKSFQWDLQYGNYRQTVGGFPSLRQFTGGYEAAGSGGVGSTASQAVDLSWITGIGNNRSWDLTNAARYGFGSSSVGGYATVGLASADGANTDDRHGHQVEENAGKVGYFSTKGASQNVANSATMCRQDTHRDLPVTDPYERDLVSGPYETDKASDIIDEYHRQMMATYCRKECGDAENTATSSSSYSTPAAESGLLAISDPGQLARSDNYDTGSYRSGCDRSGCDRSGCDRSGLGTVPACSVDGAAVTDGGASRCSSSCSGGVEQSPPVSQVPGQGVFSYDSEETDTINCLSDFENMSQDDHGNADDDGTGSATD